MEEEQKCQAFGHQFPQNTFLTPAIQRATLSLGKGKTEVLVRILIQIGSPALIGGLQKVLGSYKTQRSCMSLETTTRVTLSKAERFHLIVSLGHAMSHFQLLRRYHILELFRDCGGSGAMSCDVIMTSSGFAVSCNKRGNPLNRSVAEVTVRMLEEFFPNLDRSTNEYTRMYRWITDIRRLSHRLHLLEERFGEGILGLMLDQGLGHTDIGITDAM
jgi:hypothetical protein